MYNFKLLTTLAILSLSTILPAMAFAAPSGSDGGDWQYVNGNSWAQNYSPQTQISANNVDALEVKWIFPLEGNDGAPAGMGLLNPGQGANTPPIVLDGNVFLTTNYQRTYSVNAETGQQNWSHDYSVNLTEAADRLPINYGGFLALLVSHLHGIRVWEAGNVVLKSGLACDFYGIDVDTGETAFSVDDLCVDIPGNLYDYRQGSVSMTNIGTYEKGNQFVYVLPGVQHSWVFSGDFRHTTIGIDMDTHEILWRVYSFPPQGVLTQDWALQECSTGWFRDIPCSDVAAAGDTLEWDWANPNEPPSVWGGVTANWGMLPVDEDTGLIYTQTGNQGPYTYIGETPGPRLYGSTLMAINMDTGQRVWWSQPMPRDPYDYDCNWSGILADHPTLGKIYMKGCKEGLLHILDAATGEPIHLIDVPSEMAARGQIEAAGAITYLNGGIRYREMDPFSNYDMRVMDAPDGSPYCGDPCLLFPAWGNGLFGTDKAYNPETGVLFHYTGGLMVEIVESVRPPWEEDQAITVTAGGFPSNSSVVARNVESGEEIWSWYYDTGTQRSALVTTSDILFAGFTDGFIRFFNSATGELLREMNTGNPMSSGLTTGADAAGDQKIFAIIASGGFGSATPGTLIAVGLNDRAQAAAQTVTVTQTTRTTVTTTSATTITQTSISTTTATSTTTMTTTSATTVTSTLAAQTITQTSTAEAQTTTVTSEVTEEVGLSSTITYAAVAVAVIAIIGAAVLYTRKE
jgi:outer membrane protein assembly factor BamB